MKPNKEWFEFVYLLLALAVVILIKDEILITFGLIIFTIIMFKIKYQKGEYKVFIAGLIMGTLIEFIGSYFYKLQFWEQASLPLGLPIWLPIFWGIGFVYIRRMGNLLVKK